MKRLDPEKLRVIYSSGTTPDRLTLPRRYTLTHSDRTGELFLSIGSEYVSKQISKLYTRLMRDEVLAELIDGNGKTEFRVHCHVSGGLVIGTAKWRNTIFHDELPLVMEVLRYGDRIIYDMDPYLDKTPVNIYFHSQKIKYNKVESWGVMVDYKYV
jgi:hypothetical protein